MTDAVQYIRHYKVSDAPMKYSSNRRRTKQRRKTESEEESVTRGAGRDKCRW